VGVRRRLGVGRQLGYRAKVVPGLIQPNARSVFGVELLSVVRGDHSDRLNLPETPIVLVAPSMPTLVTLPARPRSPLETARAARQYKPLWLFFLENRRGRHSLLVN
jgi:hypothetical protein